ncbi:MAG TPA: NTP transferase domain-containing protein [Candidatus Hydrogenedentes bacterium]|nr:NTP transferase domain-containing protein [Candidatus Hydrogenedentota bacterium]
MATSKYQGVILAAGQGSRMGPFGNRVPKPIAPICNKPLAAYQLDHFQALGIDEVFVVIGHLGHRISQTLGDGSRWGLTIQYVEQERALGLAHAVCQLEAEINRPFVLMLGDIFFEASQLDGMVREFEEEKAAAVLAVKRETDPEALHRNFSVVLDDAGCVRRVVEKPVRAAGVLKGCGVYLFDLAIFDAIRRTPRTALRDEYELTDSIQILIDYDLPVRAVRVIEWDMNVTFIGDLIACCRRQLRALGASELVGEDCDIATGAELVETVVGDRVTVGHPIRLERCVVLPDLVVAGDHDYSDRVFTEDGVFAASDAH